MFQQAIPNDVQCPAMVGLRAIAWRKRSHASSLSERGSRPVNLSRYWIVDPRSSKAFASASPDGMGGMACQSGSRKWRITKSTFGNDVLEASESAGTGRPRCNRVA